MFAANRSSMDLYILWLEILFCYRVRFSTNRVFILSVFLVDQITMNIDFQFTCISRDIWQSTICGHQLCNHMVDGNIIHDPFCNGIFISFQHLSRGDQTTMDIDFQFIFYFTHSSLSNNNKLKDDINQLNY